MTKKCKCERRFPTSICSEKCIRLSVVECIGKIFHDLLLPYRYRYVIQDKHVRMIRMRRQNAKVFDFDIVFIYSMSSLLPVGVGRFYLLTLFIYEKVHPRSSILEASLALYRNIHETKASREATTLDRQRKIPLSRIMGDFSEGRFTLTSS